MPLGELFHDDNVVEIFVSVGPSAEFMATSSSVKFVHYFSALDHKILFRQALHHNQSTNLNTSLLCGVLLFLVLQKAAHALIGIARNGV